MRYLSGGSLATDEYLMAEVEAEVEAEGEAAQEATEVGEAPEGGGPRQHRRAVQEAMEVEGAPGGRTETIYEGGAGGHGRRGGARVG